MINDVRIFRKNNDLIMDIYFCLFLVVFVYVIFFFGKYVLKLINIGIVYRFVFVEIKI